MSNNKMWKCRIQERREKKHFGTFSRPPEVQQIFACVCISGIFFYMMLIQSATTTTAAHIWPTQAWLQSGTTQQVKAAAAGNFWVTK